MFANATKSAQEAPTWIGESKGGTNASGQTDRDGPANGRVAEGTDGVRSLLGKGADWRRRKSFDFGCLV